MNKINIGFIKINLDKEEVIDANSATIRFRPKTFQVFAYLCSNRGRIVSKDELMSNLWGQIIVTDDNVFKCISEIRKSLDSTSGVDVRTLSKRGYLLIESSTDNSTTVKHTEFPTLAVMPFESMSDDAVNIAKGITEDLTTLLSTHKDMYVLASHSAQVYADLNNVTTQKKTSQELQVRYLLHGSVQKEQFALRVNVQLSDTESNIQIWSERYTESGSDVFDLQDKVCTTIANRISGSAGVVFSEEHRQLQRSKPSVPEAYDLYILASDTGTTLTKEGLKRALKLYEKSIELDPHFVKAWMRAACLHLYAAACAYTDDLESTIEAYVFSAMKAVELDPNDSMCQAQAGSASCFVNQLEKGWQHFEKALFLGPNNADTLALVSYIRLTKFPTVLKDLENVRKAKELNPYHPMWYSLSHGYCAYHAMHYEEAVNALALANTDIFDMQLYTCLSHAELGNTTDMNVHLKIVLEMNPDITAEKIIEGDLILNEDVKSHILGSFVKAGIPIR